MGTNVEEESGTTRLTVVTFCLGIVVILVTVTWVYLDPSLGSKRKM